MSLRGKKKSKASAQASRQTEDSAQDTPKSLKNKQENIDEEDTQAIPQEDPDNLDDEVPPLEFVSDSTKERYEYRPVLRTEIVYRKPEDRVTSEVMTKFELCEIISIRAKQLEQGKTVFTDVGDLTDPPAIAKKEIVDKKCPLSIVRMITDRIAEKWQVNEMAIPYDAL